jgi:hypothetical protein
VEYSRFSKAKLVEEAGEGAAGVETQVLAEGVEVTLEGAAREGEEQAREGAVVGGAEQQAATGAKDAADLREPGGGVGDVLDGLTREHDVEARVGERPGAGEGNEPGLERRRARTRAAERLLGDVDGHNLDAGPHELPREEPLGAADVEQALAGADALQQEAAAQLEVGGLEPGGKLLPERLVVLAGGHRDRLEACSRALIAARGCA